MNDHQHLQCVDLESAARRTDAVNVVTATDVGIDCSVSRANASCAVAVGSCLPSTDSQGSMQTATTDQVYATTVSQHRLVQHLAVSYPMSW